MNHNGRLYIFILCLFIGQVMHGAQTAPFTPPQQPSSFIKSPFASQDSLQLPSRRGSVNIPAPVAPTTTVPATTIQSQLIEPLQQALSSAATPPAPLPQQPPTPAAASYVPAAPVPSIEPQQSPLIEPLKSALQLPETGPLTSSTVTTTTRLQPPEDPENKADIFLNFENASLSSIVAYLADQKKLNIFPHKDLAAVKVSLTTYTPYTLAQAWNVLLTQLEMNGFSMVKVGDTYRVVSNKEVTQEPLPFYSSNQGIEPEQLPDNEEIVRYAYYLRNIKSATAKDILVSMLGDRTVEANNDLDVVIITTKSRNIKFAMKIIKELDRGGLRQSIKIIQLRHIDPEMVAKLFNEDIVGGKREQESIKFLTPTAKKESFYFSTDVKVIPDTARSSLILMGQEKDIDRIIEFARVLDVPMESANSRIHIIEINYMEADKLAALLERALRPPQGQGGKGTTVVGEFKLFEDVVIKAETPKSGDDANYGSGNRLILACQPDNWARIEKLVKALDKPYPQVALEVLIVDVSKTVARELSTQMRNKNPSTLGKNAAFATTHIQGFENQTKLDINLLPTVQTNEPATVATIGRVNEADPAQSNIWATIKAVLQDDGTNIIAQPFLVANNREECVIESADILRVNGDFTNATFRNTLKRESYPATTRVTITPRINSANMVDLKVHIYVEDFRPAVGDTPPPKTKRELETRVFTGAGEVLILGGLTNSKQTENQYRTPIASNIPLLGIFFKGKRRSSDKQDLFIFIRPSIIKPRLEGSPDDYTQLKLDYAKYQILNVDSYTQSRDPIERWFFKPRNQTVRQRMTDLKAGIFRPVDDFAQGKNLPIMVNMEKDPYYSKGLEKKPKKPAKIKRPVAEKPTPPLVFRHTENRQNAKLPAAAPSS